MVHLPYINWMSSSFLKQKSFLVKDANISLVTLEKNVWHLLNLLTDNLNWYVIREFHYRGSNNLLNALKNVYFYKIVKKMYKKKDKLRKKCWEFRGDVLEVTFW